MIRFFAIVLVLASTFSAQAQELKAFQFYNKKGEKLTFAQAVDLAKPANIVLFGELHNNPICHWLQLEMTQALYRANNYQILGAEMFEADNQLVLNEYLSATIKERHFKKEAKLWDNYSTDYKPLVEFAKENKLPFIATNVPRRYASLVARSGTEALKELDKEAKENMVKIPFKFDLSTPGYQEIMNMDMGHGSGMKAENFVKAQALKDATMAHFIRENYKKKSQFIHFQGDFHSKNRGGIYWYLMDANKNYQIISISSVESETLEWDGSYANRADLILVIPSNMTKTY